MTLRSALGGWETFYQLPEILLIFLYEHLLIKMPIVINFLRVLMSRQKIQFFYFMLMVQVFL